MSVELSEIQKKSKQELINSVLVIEKYLNTTIDSQNGEECAHQLAEGILLLSTCGRIMELSTAIFEWAKGQVAVEAMADENVLRAGANIQRKWIDGRLAAYSALYARCERICKDLNSYNDGLRTIVSFNKETMRNLTR